MTRDEASPTADGALPAAGCGPLTAGCGFDVAFDSGDPLFEAGHPVADLSDVPVVGGGVGVDLVVEFLKFSWVSARKVSNRSRSPAAVAAMASILVVLSAISPLVSAALTAMAVVLALIFWLVVSKRSSTSVRKASSSLRSSLRLARVSARSLSRSPRTSLRNLSLVLFEAVSEIGLDPQSQSHEGDQHHQHGDEHFQHLGGVHVSGLYLSPMLPQKGAASCRFGDGCRGAAGAGTDRSARRSEPADAVVVGGVCSLVSNRLHGGRVGKGVVGVTAIGHAMVPVARTSPRLPEAAIVTGSRPPGDRAAPPGPSTGGTSIETARASKEHEGAGCSARRPRSRPWSGSEVPGGVGAVNRVRGRRTARTRRWAGRGVQHRALRRRWSSPLWRRGASSGSGPGQVVEAGAGGRSVKWLPGASCLAGRPLHLGGIPTPRGSPGRGSGSSGWRAPRPCTGVPRFFWGRSWGRVVPCGAQAAVRRLERARGLILSRSCCTMGGTKHPGGVGRTSFDCRGITNSRCRSAPVGRAGRAPRPGWVVVGGPVQRWGVVFFAIWGCDRGMGGHRGLCRPFRCLPVDRIGAIRGDRYEPGNHWLRIREPLQRLFLRGGAPVVYALRRISGTGSVAEGNRVLLVAGDRDGIPGGVRCRPGVCWRGEWIVGASGLHAYVSGFVALRCGIEDRILPIGGLVAGHRDGTGPRRLLI